MTSYKSDEDRTLHLKNPCHTSGSTNSDDFSFFSFSPLMVLFGVFVPTSTIPSWLYFEFNCQFALLMIHPHYRNRMNYFMNVSLTRQVTSHCHIPDSFMWKSVCSSYAKSKNNSFEKFVTSAQWLGRLTRQSLAEEEFSKKERKSQRNSMIQIVVSISWGMLHTVKARHFKNSSYMLSVRQIWTVPGVVVASRLTLAEIEP